MGLFLEKTHSNNMKRKSKILLLKQLKCTADHCTIPIRAHEGKPLEINKKFIQQMRCCTQDQWQINYSPVHQKNKKKKEKKPLLILLQQYPNGHGSRTPKLIRVQPQRNALTLLMAVNFALKKKKKKKKERKKREENFFQKKLIALSFIVG